MTATQRMGAHFANALILTAVLMGLQIASVHMLSQAHAADGKPWGTWAIAPYARDLEEACRKAPEAINGFAWPLAVKAHFKSAIGADCASEKEVWLTPHLMLEQMWSGGQKPHLMNKKPVAELPVPRSPDGRPYRKGAVAETAKAFSWSFVYEGKTYVLYLPLVCFNWSWAFGPPMPTMLVEQCATAEYAVEPNDEVRFAVLARKRLPASACWQLCDGAQCSAPPSPCDNCDWMGPKSVIPAEAEPLHTGRYVAKEKKQTLRFPREVMQEYIALCVSREKIGQSDSWVIQPSAWKTTTVVIPYGGQEWPAWGKVDASKWRKP